jgi:hypothetical protein
MTPVHCVQTSNQQHVRKCMVYVDIHSLCFAFFILAACARSPLTTPVSGHMEPGKGENLHHV